MNLFRHGRRFDRKCGSYVRIQLERQCVTMLQKCFLESSTNIKRNQFTFSSKYWIIRAPEISSLVPNCTSIYLPFIQLKKFCSEWIFFFWIIWWCLTNLEELLLRTVFAFPKDSKIGEDSRILRSIGLCLLVRADKYWRISFVASVWFFLLIVNF